MGITLMWGSSYDIGLTPFGISSFQSEQNVYITFPSWIGFGNNLALVRTMLKKIIKKHQGL